ncbi:FAST kinase domain-containing protein 5, mitochondrial [Holothuria leucospilota]|uniref:FAST kinase domain-containing protein 5, mitochondrial n=1 Tax=Holothuria leucospilota TaxID=206669 RepID=A0A9Q1BLR5_HOLLE|nr:FAST kinase domain-containing protein 5, mitochondrial [Holothuria leucospilota]
MTTPPLSCLFSRYALLIQLENNYRFTPRKLLGVHVMKKRQLSRLGYKVAEVPYYEWLPLLQQSEKKRMNYIQSKLRDADKTAEMEKGYLTT